MSPKRIEQRYKDYIKALDRLKDALSKDFTKSDIILDGSIQRFEFTFELAWKLLRDILDYKGIKANNPRDAIKESYRDT